MKSLLPLCGLIASSLIAAGNTHIVTDFDWVSGLSSTYTDDPNTEFTIVASALGDVGLPTPGPSFNALALGTNTTGPTDFQSIDYTFTFTEAVEDLDFFVIGLTNTAASSENFSNFSIAPSTVTNISNQTWDGSTLSSTSSGSQGSLTFDGPITSLSFTYTGSGVSNSGSRISGLTWTSVPEPSTSLSLILSCGLLARRRR